MEIYHKTLSVGGWVWGW